MNERFAAKLAYLRAKVNKANVQLLVDELRKGTRKQARGTLARRVGKSKQYCCLGVACEVAKANGVQLTSRYDEDLENYEYTAASGNSSSGILPEEVAKFFGFVSQNPRFLDESGELMSASTLNDDYSYRYNFNRIAAAIERTYLTAEDSDEGK